MDLTMRLRGPGPSSCGHTVCPAPTPTPTPRASASLAAGSCGDRTRIPGSVLLNDIHRVAQGFVELRVELEISWRTRLQRQHPP